MGRATNSKAGMRATARFGGAAVMLCLSTLGALASSKMAVGGLTSQPIGHYEYCKINPHECSIRPADTRPAAMTPALLDLLDQVNRTVNAAIEPMSDMEIYGKEEVWALPVNGVGDCEDYVLQKQKDLHEAGISRSNLLITVVRKPDGEGHAVLTVRTDQGDVVLDNLNDDVLAWQDTGYLYLKRQSEEHSGRWVSIRKGQTPTVASVRE